MTLATVDGETNAGIQAPANARAAKTEQNADVTRLALACWAGLVHGETAQAIASAVYAPKFRSYGPARVRSGALAPLGFRSPFEEGFSDRRLDVRRVVASEDRTISYVRFLGRHTGTFEGHAASGREMAADGYVVHRFDADGRVIEEWAVLRWA